MRNKKLVTVVILTLLFAVFSSVMFGCSSSPVSDADGNAMKGQKEYPVEVFGVRIEKKPESVAVLSNNVADIIYTLGYEGSLKAKGSNCTYSSLKDLPSIGTAGNLDTDKLKELKIDTILTQEGISSKVIHKLSTMNIKVVSFPEAKTFDELDQLYTNIGSILNGSITGYEHADKKSNEIFVNLENIGKLVGSRKTAVCYLYDNAGKSVNSSSLINKLFELAGVENVNKSPDNSYIESKDLIASNPPYIFCDPAGRQKISANPEYSGNLWALNNSRLINMDPRLIECQGKTISETVTFLIKEIYPDIFQNTATEIDVPQNSSDTASQPAESAVSSAPPAESAASSQPADTASSAPEASSQAASSSSASYTVPPGTVLQLGSTGDEVYKMQARLKELGHTYADPTGTFDELTEQGVKNFQYLSDFEATGIATEAVLNALYSPNAVTGPDYNS